MSSIPVLTIHGVDDVRLDLKTPPVAGPDDVVVDVRQCGVCGSDLGFIAAGGLLGPGAPMAIGHELSGVVSQVGENVRHVKAGDRVVVNPLAQGNNIGNGGTEGGFCPQLLVRGAARDPNAVIPVPDRLSFEQAAMVEPLAVATHAVHQGQATAGEKAVILGAGTIGLCILLVLQHYGIKDIVVADLDEHRLALAAELGARPVNPGETDMAARLRDLHGETSWLGQTLAATDLYFEATGVGSVFEAAVAMARASARLVVVGVHKAPVSVNLVDVLARELHIVGSMAYADEFDKVIEMLSSGSVDSSPLISHRFPLSAYRDALTTAADSSQSVKVLVDCQAWKA